MKKVKLSKEFFIRDDNISNCPEIDLLNLNNDLLISLCRKMFYRAFPFSKTKDIPKYGIDKRRCRITIELL